MKHNATKNGSMICGFIRQETISGRRGCTSSTHMCRRYLSTHTLFLVLGGPPIHDPSHAPVHTLTRPHATCSSGTVGHRPRLARGGGHTIHVRRLLEREGHRSCERCRCSHWWHGRGHGVAHVEQDPPGYVVTQVWLYPTIDTRTTPSFLYPLHLPLELLLPLAFLMLLIHELLLLDTPRTPRCTLLHTPIHPSKHPYTPFYAAFLAWCRCLEPLRAHWT